MATGGGATIKDRYSILRDIGEGGFARVYLAKDNELDRLVALKIFKTNCRFSEQDLSRFQREARLLAQVKHPNIVSVYAFTMAEESQPCIVMEYLEGQPLSRYLAAHEKLSPDSESHVWLQVASGLSHAHSRGLVHRDLTPANIFLIGESPAFTVKLIDFGLARMIAQTAGKLTQSGLIVGTPEYMSPEMARGQPADQRSDIYSFGCVMYEALAGKRPFFTESQIDVIHLQQHEYPLEPNFGSADPFRERQLKQIILRCLQKDPALRFQSCAELAAALSGEMEATDSLSSGGKGLISARAAMRGPYLHPWADPSGKSTSAAFARPVLAGGLIFVCLAVLAVLLQDHLINLVAHCFTAPRSSLMVNQEERFAGWLERKNKLESAEFLYGDLIERAQKSHPGEKQVMLSLDLARCFFKQGQFKKGLATITKFAENNDSFPHGSESRTNFLAAWQLLDQFEPPPAVSRDELMLRSRLLKEICLSKVADRARIVKGAARKLLSLTQKYLLGLSAAALSKWNWGPADPLEQTIEQAIWCAVSSPGFVVDDELFHLLYYELKLNRSEGLLKSLISNPTTPQAIKRRLRLDLLLRSSEKPSQLVRQLRELYAEVDEPGLKDTILCRLAAFEAALGNPDRALNDIREAKQLEEHGETAAVILQAELVEVQLLVELKQLTRAGQLCREMADRLDTLRDSFKTATGGLELMAFPGKIREPYQRAIESCLASDDLKLALKLLTDLDSLEHQYGIAPHQDWTCARLMPLLSRIKTGNIKDPSLIEKIQNLAAKVGIEEPAEQRP